MTNMALQLQYVCFTSAADDSTHRVPTLLKCKELFSWCYGKRFFIYCLLFVLIIGSRAIIVWFLPYNLKSFQLTAVMINTIHKTTLLCTLWVQKVFVSGLILNVVNLIFMQSSTYQICTCIHLMLFFIDWCSQCCSWIAYYILI